GPEAEERILRLVRAPDAVQELVADAGATAFLAGEADVTDLERLHRDHRSVDRDVDLLCLARALAREQGSENAGGERHSTRLIRDRERRRHRRIAAASALGDDAARRLRENVAARPLHPRAVRSPGAALREHDPRVSLAEILETETETIEHADAIVREDHV